jgi:nucleotide-binding universal stress UspA family protein
MDNTLAPPVVVVGIDGSADSDAALKWAQRYADATGSRLRLVVAWQWPQSYGYPMMFDGFEPDADAKRVAEKAVAELSLAPERIDTVVCEGNPSTVLLDTSADADLLVVGCHGHRGFDSLLLGSVSAHCVHPAAIPVVVVR